MRYSPRSTSFPHAFLRAPIYKAKYKIWRRKGAPKKSSTYPFAQHRPTLSIPGNISSYMNVIRIPSEITYPWSTRTFFKGFAVMMRYNGIRDGFHRLAMNLGWQNSPLSPSSTTPFKIETVWKRTENWKDASHGGIGSEWSTLTEAKLR